MFALLLKKWCKLFDQNSGGKRLKLLQIIHDSTNIILNFNCRKVHAHIVWCQCRSILQHTSVIIGV